MHASIACFDTPSCLHSRAALDIQFDGAVLRMQLQAIEPACHMHTSISAAGFQASVQILALDAAVSGVGAHRTVQTQQLDRSVSGMYVAGEFAGNTQLQLY